MCVCVCLVPVVMAWLEEMHAIVTVWAGILSENPAPRAAYNKKTLPFHFI